MKAEVPIAQIRNSFIILLMMSLMSAISNPLAGQNTSADKPGNQELQELLNQTLSEAKMPGMIAAIADSNGILTIAAAGVRKINSPETIQINDHFHLGSCTKAMTSVLMATLIQEGKIDWESTLADVFPELKTVIHPDYQKVTLHQLLTHRSGVPANASNWWAFENQEIRERRTSILKENLQKPGKSKSGEFLYSNLGYMIAGSMAERITGKSWEELITERIFVPLGMKSAGFGPPGTIDRVDQPWGHNSSGGKWQPSQADNAEALGPAGRVHCTLEDWVKFISLFIKQGNTSLLERDLLDKLIDPVGEYACGWGVTQREWANGIAIAHSGSNTMWFITVWAAPENNRAYIVGTNSCDANTAGVCDKIIGKLVGLKL